MYSEKMDCYGLNERSMYLRSILDIQIQPENLYQRIKATMEQVIPVFGWPLPIGIKTRLILKVGRKSDTESYTYGISYAGKVRFGDELDPYVTSVTACAGSYSYPVWILACEFGGILRLVFTQAFASDILVGNIEAVRRQGGLVRLAEQAGTVLLQHGFYVLRIQVAHHIPLSYL